MKTAETKLVENKGETAAVAAAGATSPEDEETVTRVALTPFRYKGRMREKDDKVQFPRVVADHMESHGFVRQPTADE